jgi:ribA/ribD-fused uncharacterized protein
MTAFETSLKQSDSKPTLPADGRVLFCRRDREQFGFLSNFHASPIVLDDRSWPTVEHYYQAQKSFAPEYQAAIAAAATPGRAKRLGTLPTLPRKVSRMSWFRRNNAAPRGDWLDVRVEVMRQALVAKFTQNLGLAARLFATGEAELIEDSARDDFWGVGANGDGDNWLGRLLMEVRHTLTGCPAEADTP